MHALRYRQTVDIAKVKFLKVYFSPNWQGIRKGKRLSMLATNTTSLPKVIWEQGRVTARVLGGRLPASSRIHSVRILFFEGYVRTLTYAILAYVNKNRVRAWQCIA